MNPTIFESQTKQQALDLCGIAAIGDIFNSLGGLSFIDSQSTILACFVQTFSAALIAKCSIALLDSADWWGPLSTASHISSFVHGCHFFVGQPNCAHSVSVGAAGCSRARPEGHMEFRYGGRVV